ncbi:MAG: hypothetical protein DRN81_03125 [Thermoproteota archaeon]|nr:MAG: hypothetical protein DRN81_03125 [Candidatus Korarchaeota archaeon]
MNLCEEIVVDLLEDHPAHPIVYGRMEIREIVRLKAENELDFNAQDYEFMAALLGKDGNHLL